MSKGGEMRGGERRIDKSKSGEKRVGGSRGERK